MPKCFKPQYKCCRCIIDFPEILINRPITLTSRAQTYLTYKSHNTVKYLVGIPPAGAITFLLAGWGGCAFNKRITSESGFYDLGHNDEILADCLPKQISVQEMDQTSRHLTNVRVHTEY